MSWMSRSAAADDHAEQQPDAGIAG